MGASGARSRGEVLPNHQPTIPPSNGEMHSTVLGGFTASLRDITPEFGASTQTRFPSTPSSGRRARRDNPRGISLSFRPMHSLQHAINQMLGERANGSPT